MCWSFYFLNNFGTLLHTCVYVHVQIYKPHFSVRAHCYISGHRCFFFIILYFFLLIKFMRRSSHQMKLSEVGFCSKVEFFTPRLVSKFFSGFFSHVEKQGKKIVFCCLKKLDLLYFLFWTDYRDLAKCSVKCGVRDENWALNPYSKKDG